jgi:hypothetical protein
MTIFFKCLKMIKLKTKKSKCKYKMMMKILLMMPQKHFKMNFKRNKILILAFEREKYLKILI